MEIILTFRGPRSKNKVKNHCSTLYPSKFNENLLTQKVLKKDDEFDSSSCLRHFATRSTRRRKIQKMHNGDDDFFCKEVANNSWPQSLI